MTLAIVGSTKLAGEPAAAALIEQVLDRYQPDRVVSGGAVGIDTMARIAAERRGIPVDEKRPLTPSWELGYKPRNIEIAVACDALVRIAMKGTKTYGSGWTRDYAAKLGKPTEEFVL